MRSHEVKTGHPLAPSLAALFQAEQQRWDRHMGSIRDVLRCHEVISSAWR